MNKEKTMDKRAAESFRADWHRLVEVALRMVPPDQTLVSLQIEENGNAVADFVLSVQRTHKLIRLEEYTAM